MNRLLILLLLIGLLYIIYKYQHLIFTSERFNSIGNLIYNQNNNTEIIQNKDLEIEKADNISQANSSLDEKIYKPDSVLGSLEVSSLFISNASDTASQTDASSFFF